MQQTILPQAPAKTAQPEAMSSKSAGRKESEARESSFDELSRAEQKRLDAKRAERQERADAVQERRAADQAEEKPDVASDHADSAHDRGENANSASTNTDKPERPVADAANEEESSETEQAVEESVTPLTFANLQSLISTTSSQQAASTAAAPASAMPMGATQASSGLIKGLQGQTQSGTGSALAPGMQLADLLSGAGASETSRPVDPTSLLTSPRFQNAMEAATQQLNPAGKLAAEANVPLRGYTTSVDVPVGQAEWGDKVMGKLSWLTARNMSVAEIHLTPPDMGPMEVKVKVHNDQASVTVHSANPVVREQLEQNSHRLRDMLGEQGLALGQFDVSDQSGQQPGGEGGESGDGSSGGGAALAGQDADSDALAAGQLDLGWRGEVDVFA